MIVYHGFYKAFRADQLLNKRKRHVKVEVILNDHSCAGKRDDSQPLYRSSQTRLPTLMYARSLCLLGPEWKKNMSCALFS